MKRPSAAILIGLGLLVALTIAGWQLGSPPTHKPPVQQPSATAVLRPPSARTENQAQTQPFDVAEEPPYGPASPPEEMKPFPTQAEAEAYFKKPNPVEKSRP